MLIPIRSGQALEQDADKFAQDFLTSLEAKFDDAVSKLKTGSRRKSRSGKTSG